MTGGRTIADDAKVPKGDGTAGWRSDFDDGALGSAGPVGGLVALVAMPVVELFRFLRRRSRRARSTDE